MGRLDAAAVLLLLAFSGCAGQDDAADGRDVPRVSDPGELPEAPAGLELQGHLSENGTQGIWIDGHHLYLTGGVGLRIVDLADPQAPVTVASDVAGTRSRDVEVFDHANGRKYAVITAANESSVGLVDVTDPAAPIVVEESVLTERAGQTCGHTIAVVPGTAVVYVSYSLCHVDRNQPDRLATGPDMTIIDYEDPLAPTMLAYKFPPFVVATGGLPRAITSVSCHEITFNAGLERGYCGAITDTIIFDTSQPLAPTILQVIDYPLVNIHHSAWDARNGTLLILGDEFAGVLAPTPMCSRDADYPTAALWFFDISDLSKPTPVGYFEVDYDADLSGEDRRPEYCSTHLGDVHEDRDLMVMGWYVAGTVLIDFSDPAAPKELARHRADGRVSTWEARFYGSYVVSADARAGTELLRVV
jgi:hypothetical protein